jgi:hypothetical protein
MFADGSGMWFGIVAGIWGIVMVAIFIQAIRLSYAIERRSAGLANTSGVPRKAMIFHTVLNLSVARDPETQALRSRMNRLLLANLIGFVLMFVYIQWSRGM